MNRIEHRFQELKKTGRKALVGYLTCGDPDEKRSESNIRTALRGGLDVLELGVPFSDPTADGPEIQVASQRALASGMTMERVLRMVARLRQQFDTPIVLFGYANPFYRYGYAKLAVAAARAGVDGFLVVDLPFEESGEMRQAIEKHGMCMIPLVAPTTPPARARMVLKGAGGFVYYIMVTGVTGARSSIVAGLGRSVAALKRCTELPIAVGFGVSNGRQAAEAAACADAVVVGSALVKAARERRLPRFMRDLRGALDRLGPC